MDRLTYKSSADGKYYLRDGCGLNTGFERLAAYEDSRLMPDEIPHWIPISEPPKYPGDYLVWRRGHARPDIMRWRKSTGFDDHTWQVYGRVIYWSTLIPPPKGEK